ncbi:hypothetical protein BS47DRAFT_1356567, partial [Hydnum rufescens UP504]
VSNGVEPLVAYVPTLKKIPPYWYPYRTFAKERWWNREILELRYALESGVTTINGKVARPGTIVRNGDRIENIVHRHEPPVTSVPIKIIHRDDELEIIVIDKPGSIVPSSRHGRYTKNSLIEILQTDFGFKKVFTVNRLDRLTSGCMIIALSSRRAKLICEEFVNGTVKKEYIARCLGEFPEEEVTVEEPLLTVDRQMGLNIVHPDGKVHSVCQNNVQENVYDKGTNTSVLHCQPWTGRSHQIRVHLQFIGYPIANDPVYGDSKVWGPNRGKGGVSLIPQSQAAPDIYYPVPSLITPKNASDGTDIGISSPVPLSGEAIGIISKLRRMKDEEEDNSRWRDVIFRAKAALSPKMRGADGIDIRTLGLHPRNLPKPQHPIPPESTPFHKESESEQTSCAPNDDHSPDFVVDAHAPSNPSAKVTPLPINAVEPLTPLKIDDISQVNPDLPPDPALFCPECYLPLLPDPKPERLFIFLHAWKYTTKEWSFKTDLPFWAAKGYVWAREEKGSDDAPTS